MTKSYEVWWQKGQETDDDMARSPRSMGKNDTNVRYN